MGRASNLYQVVYQTCSNYSEIYKSFFRSPITLVKFKSLYIRRVLPYYIGVLSITEKPRICIIETRNSDSIFMIYNKELFKEAPYYKETKQTIK